VGPVFLATDSNGQGFVAISSDSGERLWDMQCPDGLNLNEAMFDQGAQTPKEQLVAGTCNGQAFSRDPRTGEAR
jgi:glucose dehydrogenase